MRLADKEDAPITNGAGHGNEQIKKTQSNGASAKQSKAIVNGMSAKTASKRKPGEQPRMLAKCEGAACVVIGSSNILCGNT